MNPIEYLYEPIYINKSNILIPIMNDLFTSLVDIIILFMNIIYHTTIFIIKEAITFVNNNLSLTEKGLLCFCLYNLILLFLTEIIYFNDNQKMQTEIDKLKIEINKLTKIQLDEIHKFKQLNKKKIF